MPQHPAPKFQIGDKVRTISGRIFVITEVVAYSGTVPPATAYYYRGPNVRGVWEYALTLIEREGKPPLPDLVPSPYKRRNDATTPRT